MQAQAVRNILPQQLGYKPGTSLIGNFGTTQRRFGPLPFDSSPEPLNPGPAHYGESLPLEKQQRFRSSPKWRMGTAAAHGKVILPLTPGPGAHDLYAESQMLDDLHKRWPGNPSASAFSSNADRAGAGTGSDPTEPGPGQYDSAEASLFTSYSGAGARSPFLAPARRQLGSKLCRAIDASPGASFVSRSPAQRIFATAPSGPGPGAYTPIQGFDVPRERERPQSEAAGLGNLRGFDVSQPRFGRLGGEPSSAGNPGPGAHSIGRGDISSTHKPRRPLPRGVGFSSGAQRSMLGRQRPSDQEVGFQVVDYLANGPLGPPGSGRHAVTAAKSMPRRSAFTA